MKKTVPPLILLLFPALLYSFSLPGEFVYDDIAITVVENPALSGEVSVGQVLRWDRPLREFTYMLDHALWGFNPVGYHVQNVLWHLANTLWLYFLLQRLGVAAGWSFLTAFIFSIHPIQTEAVAWISGRKELLCLFFELAGCYFFVDAILHRRGSRNRQVVFYLLSLLCLLFALLSKQVAIMMPFLVLLCCGLYMLRHGVYPWKPVLKGISLHLLLMLIFLLFRFDVVEELEIVQERGTFYDPAARETEYTWLSAALTPLATLAQSVWLCLLPLDLTVERAFPPVTRLTDLRWLAGLLTLGFLLLPALYRWRRTPELPFGVLWFLIAWAPVSGAVPVAYLLADRYLYIPSIGLFLYLSGIAGGLLSRWSAAKEQRRFAGQIHPAAFVLASLITLLLSLRTVDRILDWRSEITLWQSAIAARPDYADLYANLANAYAQKEMMPEAYETWERSLKMDPNQPRTWVNMGIALKRQEKFQEAEQAYRNALHLYPDYGAAHFNLALLLEQQGRTDEALQHFEQAAATLYGKQSTELRRGLAHYHIARIAYSRGELNRAKTHQARAEALAPRLAQVYLLKGLLYRSRYETARAAFQTAISLRPDYADAYFNLGVLEWQQGDPEQALACWQKAVALNPALQAAVDRARNG